jgi:hypothetical protein
MYVVNKNIEHNGKSYSKGSEIKKDDKGFDLLKQAGHVEALSEPKAEANEGSKQEEQSVESEKPARKSNR